MHGLTNGSEEDGIQPEGPMSLSLLEREKGSAPVGHGLVIAVLEEVEGESKSGANVIAPIKSSPPRPHCLEHTGVTVTPRRHLQISIILHLIHLHEPCTACTARP